jgi:uncharacterized protein YchJ
MGHFLLSHKLTCKETTSHKNNLNALNQCEKKADIMEKAQFSQEEQHWVFSQSSVTNVHKGPCKGRRNALGLMV